MHFYIPMNKCDAAGDLLQDIPNLFQIPICIAFIIKILVRLECVKYIQFVLIISKSIIFIKHVLFYIFNEIIINLLAHVGHIFMTYVISIFINRHQIIYID